MTNTQKLSQVSHMLRDMFANGLLSKLKNGKAWIITEKGRI